MNPCGKNVIFVPSRNPASVLDALLSGLKRNNHPRRNHYGGIILSIAMLKKDSVAEPRELLGLFIDTVFRDDEDKEQILAVANDILDNPENAHSHYRTFQMKKKDGGFRTIEAPDPHLKTLQRAILDRWWYAKKKPASCVQGFVPERGTLTNAAMHLSDGIVGKNKVLIKVDIRDFFMSITRNSIMNTLMEHLGYWLSEHGHARRFPRILIQMIREHREIVETGFSKDILEKIAAEGADMDAYPEHIRSLVALETYLDWILLKLCCLDERLPQGSPCSPALANVFMKSFNSILRHRLRTELSPGCSWESTIYADDITTTVGPDMAGEDISLARNIMVSGIMRYPDISVNYRKIGVFRHGHPQKVTGITITDKLSISRKERDKVRAELHNACTGSKRLTNEDKMRLRGVRAWMRGVDAEGWDSRCEKMFTEAVGK